ncbi:MAG TPA: WD40 repeat domain-containing protein, partial [Byssovorax sp.]
MLNKVFASRGLALLLAAAAAAIAGDARAVGTRMFQLESLDDFKGGDLTGVSIDSNGYVRAGLNLGATPMPDAAAVWSAVEAPDGSVLLGTGNDGKVFRANGGRVDLVATTGEMAVSAMAIGYGGDVFLGTFPDGKIFKISANAAGGAKATVFATLTGEEDIWSLAFDAKNKALYAATGPNGKLYRVDAQGHAQVYFDSKEPHLMSVAVADDGTVYAGSQGKALLFRITGPGRATVVHHFDAEDVRAIAIAPASKGGAVYAIANKYGESFSAPKRTKPGPPGPQPARSGKAGHGWLYRFGKDGVAEQLINSDESHLISLSLGDDGLPYVGTGVEGRVYTVDDNHVERLVADTEERQVGALAMSGKRRFVASSDPAVFHEVKGVGGPDAVWTSKVLDAGLRARWGRLTWRSEGALEFSTRSGNTSTPDTTWSAWSAGLAAPGEAKAPEARYVQIRARWSRDPKATLHDVQLAFVTDNARAIVTSIEASGRAQGKGTKPGIVASGGEITKPSPTVKLTWKVDNVDQDELRYRLYFRLANQQTWRPILKPNEKLTSSSYDWDTSALP